MSRDRLAAAVVRLYPTRLRREFGAEMREWFRARWLASTSSVATARLSLVIATDLLRSWFQALRDVLWSIGPRDIVRLSGTDLRHAWKSVWRRPGLSVSATGILAIGFAFTIGALSIVRALLLSPYPYPALDRVALIRDGRPVDGAHQGRSLPAGDLVALERDARAFSAIAMWRVQSVVLGDPHGDTPEAFEGLAVEPTFFRVLGVNAELGRLLTPSEGAAAPADEVVVSDRLWRARFAGNPKVIGSAVLVNSRPSVLIGVISDAACYPSGVDAWVPLVLSPAEKAEHAVPKYRAVARLSDGYTLARARPDADRVAAALAASFPTTNRGRGFDVSELRAEQYEFTAAPFLLVQMSALLVLGLAIVNVAGLLGASAGERVREYAVRRALGGSRWSLFAGMVCEALCLTLGAIGGGLALASLLTRTVRQLLPDGMSRWFAGWSLIGLDTTVVAVGGACALVVALVLGTATGWRAVRLGAAANLRQSGRSNVSRVGLSGYAIVVAQVALAMALVVCGGLVIGGFQRIAGVFDTLDPTHTVVFRVTRPATSTAEALVDFHHRLRDDIRALPGVTAVGLIQNHPASNVPCPIVPVVVDGRPVPQVNDRFHADLQTISAGALEAFAMKVSQGRPIDDSDGASSERVAMVSESMARTLWPGGTPVGARIKIGADPAPWTTVVGVASDLKVNWYDADRRPTVYMPFEQVPLSDAYVVVRTVGDPTALAAATREVVHAVDRMQPIPLPRALEGEVSDSITPIRALSFLLAGAGLVAVILAAAGIYAAIASAVVARRREFGLRLALGATPPAIGRLMLGRALWLALVGIALGTPCALVAAAALRNALFGVAAPSSFVVIGSAVGLIAVAGVASALPAASAMRTDPASLLRSD